MGYYADAREGRCVELLLTEVQGGVHGTAIKMLSRLEKAKRDGVIPSTGPSAKGFTSHWLRNRKWCEDVGYKCVTNCSWST